MGYEVDIVEVPARMLAVSRFRVALGDLGSMAERMGAAFGAVIGALGRAGLTATGPAVACYEHADDGFDVAAGFPIAGSFGGAADVATMELPAAKVAHTTHVGPYDDLPRAYDALRAGAEELGWRLDDGAPMWEEYLTGPDVPPEQTRTEVYWPLDPH